MKLIQFRTPGTVGVLECLDVPIPEPRSDEVLIRAHAIGVGMPDVLIRAGTYNFMPPLPAVPGQELSGTIEKVGAGVTTRRVGQRVYTSARERPHRGGHYAEFVATPADATFLLPDTVTFDTAATLAAALIERNRIQRAEYERRAAQSSLGIAPFRTTWPVGTVLEAEWVTEHLGVSPSKHRGGGQ